MLRPTLGFCASFAVLLAGCVPGMQRLERRVIPAREALPMHSPSTTLKAHLLDGRVVMFETWAAWPDSVTGTGRVYDVERRPGAPGRVVVARDSVALFESNRAAVSGAQTALTVITGASAALTVFCLTNTKACFGSCPTFYAPDDGAPGGAPALQAEGYSRSIVPALEEADVDALFRSAPAGERFELRMTNEALETHVTAHADLLAVPRSAGARVYHDPASGRFTLATDEQAPAACLGPEGGCMGGLALFDGVERVREADAHDLAARETIELTFDAGPEGPLGLVVSARQSLVSTFLFYQMLAYMGEDAGAWMARLETAARAEAAAGRVYRPALTTRLGGIEVEAWTGSAWAPAGTIDEHGPLALDVHLVPLPAVPSGPVRVRLRMAQGVWRLDGVRLARLGPDVAPVRVAPYEVLREPTDPLPGDAERGLTTDPEALADLVDPARHLVTLPGDALRLRYALPTAPAGADTWELFLESRGYYLEWMRDEWLPERDPEALAQMLFAPDEALRALAPRFKALEPLMEEAFWNSRYAAPAPPPLALRP